MEAGTFSLVPIDAIQDKRLTLEQLRVLIALFSFRNKSTNTVWPSRQAIAERTGMHPSNISSATTALERLGWLEKDGFGGYSKATRYTISTPDLPGQTVAHSATVAESATVAHSATPPLAESATTPVADSATRKEDTNEHTNEQTSNTAREKNPAFNPKAKLLEMGVHDEQVIADWFELRKKKRAPVTATVLKLLKAEATKAGFDIERALLVCIDRGWQGFKAEWYLSRPDQQHADRRQQQRREPTRHERIADNIARLTGQHRQQEPDDDDPGVIHGTAQRVD